MKVLQKHAFKIISRIFRQGSLAHAWLLAGQEGTGKEELARIIAGLLMCENPVHEADHVFPCGMCSHCAKLSRDTHPDLVVTEPEGAFIKLPQVHALQKNISYSPLEARNRAVLVLHAHKMNREAANALLKTLEEPPDRTFLILTASSINALLPTIVSRCQVISCSGLEAGVIAEILSREERCSREEAETAARLSDGSLARARYTLENGAGFRDMFFRFMALAPDRRFGIFFDLSKVMSEDVDSLMLSVTMLRSIVRDMLVLKAGGKETDLLNMDRIPELQNAASALSTESLSDYADRLEKMERLSIRNINRGMLANSLLIFWGRPESGQKNMRRSGYH